MKSIHSVRTSFLCFLMALAWGCGDGDDTADLIAGPVANDQIVHVPLFITDDNGQVPTDPATRLYEARKKNAILAPDGHHLTLAEFNRVSGSATVSCSKDGTRAAMRVQGLVPNAVYTAWNVVFKAPGFDPTFANMTGLGALGAPGGQASVFRSSAAGDGEIVATTPPGSLSIMGAIARCALTEEFEWHLVGTYHMDNQAHGAQIGPDGTAVEQFAFVFKR